MAVFHAGDGSGYEFVASAILEVDNLNPQLAARMTGVFLPWKKFTGGRGDLMKVQLERMLASQLSKDTKEIVTRALK